jgi:hypothetical protein
MAFPPNARTIGARGEIAAVVFLLGAFTAMELAFPTFPAMLFGSGGGGLIMDQFLAAQILDMLRENSLWELFWSGRLPSVRTHYHSTLMAYLYIPFLKVFGRSWMLAKHWPVFWALLSLLFAYLFVRNVFDRRSALLALLLIVVHPTYVMGIRMGGGLLSHMHFFSMGTLCFLGFWWTTRRTVWFGAAMFFIGLGMSTQLWFYWFPAGLLVSGLVFFKEIRERFGLRGESARRLAGIGLLCLAAGSSLIIYREAVHKLDSLAMLVSRFSVTSTSPDPEGYHPSHVLAVLADFNSLLAGRDIFNILRPFASLPIDLPYADLAYPPIFWVAWAFLFPRTAGGLSGPPARMLALVFAVMLALSPLGPIGAPTLHFFFLYPFPPLLLAVAAGTALRAAQNRRWLNVPLGGVLILLAFGETANLSRYLREFFEGQHTTFRSFYTKPFYETAAWLKKENLSSEPIVIFGDYEEMERHLYFVLPESRFRSIRVNVDFGTLSADPAELSVLRRAAEEGALFIRSVHEVHDAFMKRLLSILSPVVRLDPLARFTDENGRPAFEVYRLSPEGPAPESP